MAGGPKLFGRMWKPPGFRRRKSYPALVHVYGGPYSQMVASYIIFDCGVYLLPILLQIAETSIFYNLWAIYMTSQHNMIIVSVDGQGTGFRGNK